MENEDDHEELTNEEKIEVFINTAGCIGIIVTSLYAMTLICKSKATRYNWSLLAITLLNLVYSTTGMALVCSQFLIQLSSYETYGLLYVNACC